jgi:hypothetical protein
LLSDGQQKSRHRLDDQGEPTCLVHHRGKTVTKPLALSGLGLALSEKQIPQVVENLESGGKSIEALERVATRPRQVRYLVSRTLAWRVQEVPATANINPGRSNIDFAFLGQGCLVAERMP